MFDVQERYVRVHDESTMEIRDFLRNKFMYGIDMSEGKSTSGYVRFNLKKVI
jgi:hypothetical protein